MFCSKCGNDLSETARFCNQCGNVIVQNKPDQTAGFTQANVAPKKKSGVIVKIAVILGFVVFGVVAFFLIFGISKKEENTYPISAKENAAGIWRGVCEVTAAPKEFGYDELSFEIGFIDKETAASIDGLKEGVYLFRVGEGFLLKNIEMEEDKIKLSGDINQVYFSIDDENYNDVFEIESICFDGGLSETYVTETDSRVMGGRYSLNHQTKTEVYGYTSSRQYEGTGSLECEFGTVSFEFSFKNRDFDYK